MIYQDQWQLNFDILFILATFLFSLCHLLPRPNFSGTRSHSHGTKEVGVLDHHHLLPHLLCRESREVGWDLFSGILVAPVRIQLYSISIRDHNADQVWGDMFVQKSTGGKEHWPHRVVHLCSVHQMSWDKTLQDITRWDLGKAMPSTPHHDLDLRISRLCNSLIGCWKYCILSYCQHQHHHHHHHHVHHVFLLSSSSCSTYCSYYSYSSTSFSSSLLSSSTSDIHRHVYHHVHPYPHPHPFIIIHLWLSIHHHLFMIHSSLYF